MKTSEFRRDSLIAVADFETFTKNSNYFKKHGHTDVGLYNTFIWCFTFSKCFK